MGFEKQKPQPTDLWTVERMMMLDPAVKWTAVSLWAFADDHGRQTRTDWILRRALYPRDELSREQFDSHLLELAIADVIVLYEVAGVEYYAMVNVPSVQHRKESTFPPPPEDVTKPSRSHQEGFTAWEGEGEGAGKQGGERASDRDAPSPFCPKHQPTFGTDENCRACGRRRLALAEYWKMSRSSPEAGSSESAE